MNDILYIKQALLPVKLLFHKIAAMLGLHSADDGVEMMECPEYYRPNEKLVDRYFTEVVLEWFRKSSSFPCSNVTWRNVVIVIAAKEGGNNTQHALVVARNHMHLHKETVLQCSYPVALTAIH